MEVEGDDDDSGDDVEFEAAGGATGGEGSVMASSMYVQQISTSQFNDQSHVMTKAAVDDLMHTEIYQKMMNTCTSCQACWLYRQMTQDCNECGGFAMQRPCPVCDGRCQNVWSRDVKMSHSFRRAHWDGKCSLPQDQQMAMLFQKCVETDEETIVNGMEDLHTS